MVRQYIGARYTPRFMGTHDATQAYEALDVVDNGTGTTYIARVPVPPNTPLTDSDYWLVYGASSGAILDLQTRVGSIENTIPAIQSSILSIGGQVATNTGNIANNSAAITALNTKVDTKLTDIKSRQWLFLGDSYDVINPNTSWIDSAAFYMGIPSANWRKRSAGGYGFISTGASKTWQALLEAQPVAEAADITDLVICGGLNDMNYNETDIYNAMVSHKIFFESTFPKLKRVYIGFIGWAQITNHRTKLPGVMNSYKTSSIRLGWDYLNGVENILKYVPYLSNIDNAHPTDAGAIALAVGITDALKTGYCTTYNTGVTTYTPYTSFVTGDDFNISETLFNGLIRSVIANTTLTLAASMGVGLHKIATCDALKTSMNINDSWNVDVANLSSGTYFPGLLIKTAPDEISLQYSSAATLSVGTVLRIIGSTNSTIIR